MTVCPNEISFEFKSKTITITRKDLENCCIDVKKSLTQMIHSLQIENPFLLNSGCIQLLGGCSRILSLQEHIKKLLPNFKLLKTMDVTSSVCIGACYLVNNEIQSNIQTHEQLITFESALKTSNNVYNIFKYGNSISFNPAIKMRYVEPNQMFTIVDKNDDDQEFIKFKINSQKLNYYNMFYSGNSIVDIDFKLNKFLMPVPDQSLMVNYFGEKILLSLDYFRIGWEISSDDLTKSKRLINSLLTAIKQRFEVEKHLNSIDEYKISIQRKLNNYGFLNWRKFAFAGICRFIDYKCNTCLQKNRIECSEEKVNSILQDFKELVKFTLNIDDDDNEQTQKQIAIDDLNDLVETCKQVGIKCDDVSSWISKHSKKASLDDVVKQIKILEKRGKETQNSYN